MEIPTKIITPADILRGCADLFESRNPEYGDNYRRFGEILRLLMPQGVHVESPEDMSRLGVFVQVVSKIARYGNNFESGHPDSLDDLIVYAAMLRDLDGVRFEGRI